MSATRFHHVIVAICATEVEVRIVVNTISHNDNFLVAAGVIFDGIEHILPQEGASHCAISAKLHEWPTAQAFILLVFLRSRHLSFPRLSILRPLGLTLERAPGILCLFSCHPPNAKNNLSASSMWRRIESCIHDCFLEKIRRGGCHWYGLHRPWRAGQFYKLWKLQGHWICILTNGKHGVTNALGSKIFQDLICASLVPARRMPRRISNVDEKPCLWAPVKPQNFFQCSNHIFRPITSTISIHWTQKTPDLRGICSEAVLLKLDWIFLIAVAQEGYAEIGVMTL